MYDSQIGDLIQRWHSVPDTRGIRTSLLTVVAFLLSESQVRQETGLISVRAFMEQRAKEAIDAKKYAEASCFALLLAEFYDVFGGRF